MNCKQMQAQELVELCGSKPKLQYRFMPRPYWPPELYSFGRYIRIYGFYPAGLPLCIYTDHGISFMDNPAKHELESDAPCQLYHSPRLVAAWKKVSAKPCYVFFSPFVFYRRKNKVERVDGARGTIAFPAHSTPSIDDVSDLEAYISQLLELPDEFQPVSVCLHMHDINKGRHELFHKHNIPVYTAGNSQDIRFAARFYSILRNFSYATSNMIGSYTYYAVEMGIPFSVYGERQKFVNKGDPNMPKGEYDPYREVQSYKIAHDMFIGLHTKISPAQKKFVETELGLIDGISRAKMASVLYGSLLKWSCSLSGLRHMAEHSKRLVNGLNQRARRWAAR